MKKLNLIISIILFLFCIVNVNALVTTNGNITTDDTYTIVSFYSNGTFNTTSNIIADVLIIAGGGAGGGVSDGGGGGAGGLIYLSNITINSGNYNAIIGLGGLGSTSQIVGENGQNSSFYNYIAIGGGGGGSGDVNVNGNTGGSGGGSGYKGNSRALSIQNSTLGYGIGFSGGAGYSNPNYFGGGGGGAGGNGLDATGSGSLGGNGLNYSISGFSKCYASGGSGGGYGASVFGGCNGLNGGNGANTGVSNATNGLSNTGSGGGGAGQGSTTLGGSGGSGIIIVRYILINTTTQSYNVSTTQNLNNLTTSTINLTIGASITSNMNITANGTATLYYTINTSLNNGCNKFYQSVCQNYGTYYNTTMTQLSNSTFNKHLSDNDILPAYYPFNYEFMQTATTLNDTIYSGNNILMNITNFSTQINYTLNLEFDAVNKTDVLSNLLIYYCNSTYITNVGNPSLRPNACELIDSYSATTNCSHYHGTRCDRDIPVVVSTINKTQNSFIAIIGQSNALNGWTFSYVLNSSYDNSSFRIGAFNSFDSNSAKTNKIYNIHLHSYSANDNFHYYVNYTNNGTSGISTTKYLFYNISYQPPSASDFINPNCANSSNLIYTIGSTNNYTINWTTSTSQLGFPITYSIYYSDILDLSRVLINTTTNTFYIWNSSVINSITPNNYYLYVVSSDGISSDIGKSGCTINLCKNNYVRTVQPCITNAKLINYTDSNNCNEQLNLPSDIGQYEYCNETQYIQNVYTTDITILVIILIMIIISTICAIFVHEIFFVLNTVLIGLALAVFIEYNYPDIIKLACVILMIVFIGVAVLVHKIRK